MAERNLAVVPNYEVDLVSEKRVQMVRDKFANGAPQDEFDLFIAFCRAKNLDPLQRQVYLIPRWDKNKNANVWSIQTSIDGYRAIADRTGCYAGSDDAIFTESGQKVWDKPRPDTAKVTVWKMVQGQRCPFTATARWDEYYQEKSPLWGRMPHTMLAKCSESLALRKAFPEQLSGVYTDTEMEQAGMPADATPRVVGSQQEITTRRLEKVAESVAPVRQDVDVETGEIIEAESRTVGQPKQKTDHELALDRYFAVSGERGFTNAGNKLFAIALRPTRENGPTTSRKQLTAQELRDLAHVMADNVEPATRDEHKKILFVAPPVEFANAIADAADQTRLAEIGAKVSAGAISAPWLRKMWNHRNKEVPAVADAQPLLVDAPGAAGNDRHTA